MSGLCKKILPLLALVLAILLCACDTAPADPTDGTTTSPTTEATTEPTTVPTTEPITEPETEPTTEPPVVFSQRDYLTMLEGISVSTWTLEDETVYIRTEDFLATAGIEADELPETETVMDSDGLEYLPLYPVVEALGYPVWEDVDFSTTYITPSAAPFEIPVNVQVPVLMYHAVGDDLWGSDELFVSTTDMEAQLQYLVENGYDPIWFSDLKDIEQYDKPVILTFDDGYNDNYTILLPLLQKYNVKVTVFVLAGLLDQPHKMSWGQVKEMSQSGLVSIQSHGMYHPKMADLSEDELIFEMGDSKNSITRMSGKIPYVFCYPSGSYSDLSLEVTARYYDFGLKMNGNMYCTGDNPYLVNRYYVSRYTSLSTFISFIAGAGVPAG